MITARVTSKGQMAIPKAVKDKLGVAFGEDIVFEEKNRVSVIRKA
ncbi:MAG: AbrB/MazE/SpoVT family DNA-binding domain-containing protein [Candidatus Methanomethylicaceae archaeon]